MARGSFGRPEVAATYASAPLFAAGEELGILADVAGLTGAERVLDVGTAAGHTALALAPRAGLVVATDPSLAMLREARRLAAGRGLANVALAAAIADPLPFRDETFDLATCRYAAHHFPDLPGAAMEVARVLRPGGRVLVVDTIAPEDAALDAFINEVETLRDPSHVRNQTVSGWRNLIERAGLRTTVDSDIAVTKLTTENWLERSQTPPDRAEEVRRRLRTASPAAVNAFQITPATFAVRKLILVGRT